MTLDETVSNMRKLPPESSAATLCHCNNGTRPTQGS